MKHRVPMPSIKRTWKHTVHVTSVHTSDKLGVAYHDEGRVLKAVAGKHLCAAAVVVHNEEFNNLHQCTRGGSSWKFVLPARCTFS